MKKYFKLYGDKWWGKRVTFHRKGSAFCFETGYRLSDFQFGWQFCLGTGQICVGPFWFAVSYVQPGYRHL